MLFRNKISWSY